jgi:hypothetical protein
MIGKNNSLFLPAAGFSSYALGWVRKDSESCINCSVADTDYTEMVIAVFSFLDEYFA